MVWEFLYTDKVNGKVTVMMANGRMGNFMEKVLLVGQTDKGFSVNGKIVCSGISTVMTNLEE